MSDKNSSENEKKSLLCLFKVKRSPKFKKDRHLLPTVFLVNFTANRISEKKETTNFSKKGRWRWRMERSKRGWLQHREAQRLLQDNKKCVALVCFYNYLYPPKDSKHIITNFIRNKYLTQLKNSLVCFHGF